MNLDFIRRKTKFMSTEKRPIKFYGHTKRRTTNEMKKHGCEVNSLNKIIWCRCAVRYTIFYINAFVSLKYYDKKERNGTVKMKWTNHPPNSSPRSWPFVWKCLWIAHPYILWWRQWRIAHRPKVFHKTFIWYRERESKERERLLRIPMVRLILATALCEFTQTSIWLNPRCGIHLPFGKMLRLWEILLVLLPSSPLPPLLFLLNP